MGRRSIIQADQSYSFSDYFKLFIFGLFQVEFCTAGQEPILYGAISTGNIWQLGCFDQQAKVITQNFNLYRVPGDLEELLRILVRLLGV